MANNLGNKETMAKNILYYMGKKNKTASEICEYLNIPLSTFSYWTHAKTYPRIDKIEMLANYFGITKADLVEEPIQRIDFDSMSAKRKELIEIINQMTDEEVNAALMIFKRKL